MKLITAALVALLLASSCGPNSLASPTAPVRIARPMRDGSFTVPTAEGVVFRYIDSIGYGANSGLLALDAEGQVWLRYSSGGWFALAASPLPFISVTGAANGELYALDGNGQVWKYFGGWSAEVGP